MTRHTGRAAGTDAQVAVQWRWIENLWGNVRQFIDGVSINGRQPYFCIDPANFSDGSTTNYTQLGYSCATSSGYIKTHGVDVNSPWFAAPDTVGGSASTYIPDYYYQTTGWVVAIVGGDWDGGANAGFWYWNANNSATNTNTDLGSRLLFLP